MRTTLRTGRTTGGRYTSNHEHIWAQLDTAAPDSQYWHKEAMRVCGQLASLMGYDAYCQWIDAQADWKHWKGLYDLVGNELCMFRA